MITPVTIPNVNANDQEVLVVRWHIGDGAQIMAGASLVEIETTKSVVMIDAPEAGWVRRGAVEGVELPVGAVVAWIASEEAELPAAGGGPAEIVPSAAKTIDAGPAPIVDVSTSASPTGSPLSTLSTSSTLSTQALVVPVFVGAQGELPALTETRTRFSPKAQQLIEALGLDRTALENAHLGLVTASALKALLGGVSDTTSASKSTTPANARPHPANATAVATASAASVTDGLRRERAGIGKRAEISALQTGAEGVLRSSLTVYFDSIPVRSAVGDDGVLPLILKETALLVAARPAFTAFHEAGATVFLDAVHLGVAVDLGSGLKVVTLRHANRVDAEELKASLADLVLATYEQRLTPENTTGSTFTVTDLSSMDVLHFEPLINGRQSAILGVGGDSHLPGHPMSLTLAFDHRVLTGRLVAEFLSELRTRIQSVGAGWTAAIATGTASAAADDVTAITPKIEAPCCDRCGVEASDYYAQFGRAGLMQNYTRADGTTGRVCHTCVALG